MIGWAYLAIEFWIACVIIWFAKWVWRWLTR
jgi:hypothetical protein